jgi:hypothetical protein
MSPLGLGNAIYNHSAWGMFDFKKRDSDRNTISHFCLDGTYEYGDYFGNYMAGFSAGLLDSKMKGIPGIPPFANYAGVHGFGEIYQIGGTFIGGEHFNFDMDSWPAIDRGYRDAYKYKSKKIWSNLR